MNKPGILHDPEFQAWLRRDGNISAALIELWDVADRIDSLVSRNPPDAVGQQTEILRQCIDRISENLYPDYERAER